MVEKSVTTLVDLLRVRAVQQPDRPAFTFWAEEQEMRFTYAELDRKARALGAVLQSVSTPGERALLLYPPGHEYLIAFFGCLYAGILAVPAYPPRLNGSLDRLQAIVHDAQATMALTTASIRSKVEHRFVDATGLQGLKWLDTETLSPEFAENWENPNLKSENLAFLQYTSGSTSTPKGVMVSHGNLLHNLDLIQESFATTAESDSVIWLPPYHDMGLIGGILQPLYAGFHATLMSPFAFMQRPLQWLELITQKKARVSGGPNFAYDLCVQKVMKEQKAGLDLSSWEVAFTGAEPIRKETLDHFAETFASCGFRREAFYPCYGLAEATLFVTGGFKTELPVVRAFDAEGLEQNRVRVVSDALEGARMLVSSGQPRMAKQQVEIVDPQTGTRCVEDQVGEIWVAGPSVAKGYWKRPEQTQQTFGAKLESTGGEPFLRTGDLGFVREGELYVTGRLKDLIIIRGRNFYPQDIEYTMQESHVALRSGCGAAFTVEVEGEERLVVVQEIERQHRKTNLDNVVACIRQAVSVEHQLPLHAIVLIRPATAPLTSSGKIQRHACRERYLNGTLDVMKLHEVDGVQSVEGISYDAADAVSGGEPITREQLLQMAPMERLTTVKNHLVTKTASILRMDRAFVDVDKSLGALGLDSLMAVELKDALEESFGVVLPLVTFLEGPSLAQVAVEVVTRVEAQAQTVEQSLVSPQDSVLEGQSLASSQDSVLEGQSQASPQASVLEGQSLASSQVSVSAGHSRFSSQAPLSYGQRALWFMQRLAPDSTAYNIAHAVRIPGELHVVALRSAFEKVVQRHPQLRTTFTTQDEQPIQQMHDQFDLSFDVQDASEWGEAVLQERLTQLAYTSFDLEKGPLLRIHLFSRSAEDHVLLLTVHHIIVDFWSLGVLIHELQQFYTAELQGTTCTLNAPRSRYVDHVAWQSDLVNGTDGERLWSYWQEQLSGELSILNLPTDRPRPPVQTYRGASCSFRLNAELTSRLKEISQAEGATLYMALLSLYQILLHRYTGQEDILVGSPTAGRSSAKYRELIGYFVNPVVLRANFAGEHTFAGFLQQVRQTVLGALQHQEYPFPLLVEKVQPKRDPSYPPLFQTMFVLQKSHVLDDQGLTAFALSEDGAQMQAGDLTFESMSLEQRTAQFDLTLSMAEVKGEIVASFEYNRDLFDGTTIERMAEHFQTVAAGLLANPDGLLADAPILTPDEKQLLLYDWNNTASDVQTEECLHQKFEAQAAQTPDLVAVVFADEQLTYRELNERANRLAHHLQHLGIGPDVTVGICVERSVEMIVGLLGILKAGGAYVPLDPVNPAERLRFILEDAKAPVLLTQKKLANLLPDHTAKTVYLDAEEAYWKSEFALNLNVEMTSDHLAYVIYTSGTTGKPKGVCVPHRGVLNLLFDMERRRALVTGDGCSVFSSFGFDVSVYEMYASLLFGGRLHLVPEHLRTDVPAFFRWLEACDIQNAYLPAFLLQDFVHWLREGKGSLHMRRILVGVEPLPEPLLAEICRLQPDATVINGYGPTETSIFVTVYNVNPERVKERNTPIGGPVDNMHTYVLDRRLQLVPIGVPGELYVGGVGVVRGYLNRPELTAERFISSPFVAGERLYKTGDLVRYNADGQIEFIGRIDQQVKLRGFRIELGEIEFVLAEHPDVNDVVVTAREDVHGEKRLVAYIIPELFIAETLTATELRKTLQAHLPPYMVPSAFVFLDVFPLTTNGKIDMRALPEPEHMREFEQAFVAPSTPVEEMVAGIWSDVLRMEQVGVQDDFFTLGGHSLLATQVISRVNAAFQVEIPLSKLFESPTVAGLAACIEQAGQSSGIERLPAPQILPLARLAQLPLSFAQERMWFFEQFQSGTATYNMPGAVRLTGQLDAHALERSLQEIWRRHEALRMNFIVVDGKAVATLSPDHALLLSVRDLRHLPEPKREAEMLRLSHEEAQKPFDLTNDALVRTTLLQLGNEEHVLLLTMHHIVSDGWSIGVFIREMATLYAAFLQGHEASLPALNVQYADFAHWQRQWLRGELLDTQLGYWKQQLRGTLPVLQLPTDRPRPAMQTFHGASVPVELPTTLYGALKQLSRREGVTLYMTLLSAFKTLLYRYSGQDDILVGSPIAGRNREEIEHLIGYFVNTLVMRTDLSGNLTFRDLLSRVRQVALEAYANQDLPFEKLVEEIQPVRSMTHSPLFQVMFALQHAPMSELELPGLTVNLLQADSGTAKFDLTLSLTESESGLTGTLEFNTELFDRATVERMVGHLHVLLEAIVSQPEQTISTLPLLTDAERTQVLVEWNDNQADYPVDTCLHQLFETHAERTPDAIAVVYDDQQMTYGELNRRANQLAHRLRRMGVGADVLVGICMERSIEMIVAVLGILKAGGAYVPLDATYPKDRLAFMLEDAQLSVVLTQERLLDKLPAHQAEVICLELCLMILDGESEETPVCEITPDHMAYVIYTSGTTGLPKGVCVPHRGVVNLMTDFNNRKPVIPGDGCAFWSNFGFDLSVMEIFAGLLFGGRLHPLRDELRADSMGYFRWLASSDLRYAYMPPFMLKDFVQWLSSGAGKQSLHVRRILVGVEPNHEPLLVEICKLMPDVTIINAYGPTEASICATLYAVEPARVQDRNTPIGVPVQNTHVYLLDAQLQPVPIGVPGELHTGGVHLARGYLNRPELTAEKFISNPFQNDETHNASARLYKTGDMVRYLPDGNIEYISRIDNQVKVRGFRIELGEIESVLIQHPSVRETVVVACELGTANADTTSSVGTKTLVAYLVTDAQQAPAITELRHYLKDKLPDYMVPSAFVLLDEMPLTLNGKIDRRALPAPDASSLQRTEYVAARTPVEEVLATVFAEVLEVEQVGVYDNFFEVGGHSLLATQVVSRIRSAFHVELPLRALFETGTVAELAVAIEHAQQEQVQEPGGLGQLASHAELPLVVLPREEYLIQHITSSKASLSFANEAYAFPLSFAQQRLWFLEQFMPGNTAYNIPVAVRLQGVLNVYALEESLGETVRRHEALRTTFGMIEGQPMQIVEQGMTLQLPVIDLREFPEGDREGLAMQLATEEAKMPFDLTHGPLVRTTLLRLTEQEHVLLLTMHHIVSDGWSMGVFIQEIAALYEAYIRGAHAALLSLPVQYADFAHWQKNWLAGGVLEHQLAYWKQKLAGRLPVLQLPTDRTRQAVQNFVGANLPIQFSPEITQALKELAQREGVTLYMTLLAAFKTLLYRYTGQEDILVGSPIANRIREEIEGLIGFFVNTLVLRTDMSGGLSFRDLLTRVREVSLEAYAHQDVPFEKLVEELQPERDLSHTPLFQVMFILQNAPMGEMELPGLSLYPLPTDNGTSKFDLTLSLTENAEGLAGSFEYSTDLFDESTVQRMFTHLQNLLVGILANPEQNLTDIPLLTEAEREQLLVEWNDTAVAYPSGLCAHHLFEAQVERTPDTVALMVGEDSLTYRELNQLTNQVAHHLQSLGVGPEVCVGLSMERSLEMVIGLLAIHKAGGAYVSLDPAYPQDRLAFMLVETKIPVLLTQSHLTEVLSVVMDTDSKAKVVTLDTAWEAITELSEENPTSGVTPDNLGYVLYTSGSTGKPKGVAMGHGPLCNLIKWQVEDSVVGVGSKTLQFASLNFDVSFQEIMSTFASGGTLVVALEHLRKDPVQMLHVITEQRVERLFLPFVAFQQLAEAADGDVPVPTALREIITAGEQLQMTRQISNWLQQLPNCTLTNQYGPSETHCVTSYKLTGSAKQWPALPPIGRPLANAEMYLLDAALQPVPIGVPGELYIGGPVLARGYLERKEMTAERFIANPFKSKEDPNARLYKTGDLGLYLSDGNIKYLGRIDQQVKIRGFRIELGEIEEILTQHPAVQETVAIAREDVPGVKQLVAYLVTNSAQTVTISDLRSFLQKKLPDYMVPTVFMFLDALPLTPNRKVDRRALPKPETHRPELQVAYVAPETELERTIADVWQEVLRVEQVGVYDNFFDLGGHSLLVVQVHNKLRERVDVDLTVVQLFQYPTVSSLADYLSQDPNGPSSAVKQSQNRAESRRESKTRRQARAKQRSLIKKGEQVDE